MNREISSDKVIVVEGNDDEGFIQAILNHENINGCQIIPINGKTKFKKKISTLIKTSNFTQVVKKFAVIRDADNDMESAFKSSCSALKSNKLIPPTEVNSFSDENPEVGIFIFCKPDDNSGILEDLCLETVKNTEAMKCVDIFFDCVMKLSDKPRNISKSRCQAYRAAMKESYPHVGIAALNGIYDLNSQVLTSLKTFLSKFEEE